eukprot:1804532-Rhodomonas_salina.8
MPTDAPLPLLSLPRTAVSLRHKVCSHWDPSRSFAVASKLPKAWPATPTSTTPSPHTLAFAELHSAVSFKLPGSVTACDARVCTVHTS